ncbi:MAG: CDP-alcohol phosphatidyltransferase family protein [Caldilineales bacterium]|nr:CDP-alcohol phosphatidyltransferase family protein [Caldilineales bacterium]MDW8316540.1 CDP-alcohol phosphatidyltransferase family protein [Anaerolineae bacterium]
MSTDPKEHRRVNDILLGPLERPALQWLAARQPAWMTPDKLTAIGTFGGLVIFVSYWLSNFNPAWLWVANLGLVINWYGDSLDGTLARYRNIQRPKYGFFIDHTIDGLNEMLVILGMGVSPYVSFNVAAMALIGYLLMSVYVYVRTFVTGVFKISYGKLGPTEGRVIIGLLNVGMFFLGPRAVQTPWGPVLPLDIAVAALAALLLAMYLGNTLRTARELSGIDRPPAAQ